MKIISGDYVLICDEKFTILHNHAIVYKERIIDIDTIENIQKKYKEPIEYAGKYSVLMPGLINAHIHLEFCANKTTLDYGNFTSWLYSIINHRDTLIEKATKDVIDKELTEMIKYGITSAGAISTYGFDMQACIESPLNIVYFTEVLGSKAEMIDTLLSDFKNKFNSALAHKANDFIPGIAIHSPYSTHPFLIREVLNLAREHDTPVSTHFMESPEEKEWLEKSKGKFKTFFNTFFNTNTPLQSPEEFLQQFKYTKNLSFTHCVETSKEHLQYIEKINASIIHCPNSNRLLNNSILNIKNIKNIPLAIGTDGLSSNHSLNLFEEIRNAFYMHTKINTNKLAKRLLLAATAGGAQALNLQKKGSLKIGYDSDIIAFNLPSEVLNLEQLATMIILHHTKTTYTIIGGMNETI